ncbi:hypothetical protein OAI31_00775, partial [Flavobacteriaceae bacterium]|nr:hypothetical protein [Flavobacteriaceae bacterium]
MNTTRKMVSSKVLGGMVLPAHNKQTLLVYLQSTYGDNLLLSNISFMFSKPQYGTKSIKKIN